MPGSLWIDFLYGQSKAEGSWNKKGNGCVCYQHNDPLLQRICKAYNNRLLYRCTFGLLFHESMAPGFCLPDIDTVACIYNRCRFNAGYRVTNGELSIGGGGEGKSG